MNTLTWDNNVAACNALAAAMVPAAVNVPALARHANPRTKNKRGDTVEFRVPPGYFACIAQR
jgi:hypothetical protein